MESMEQIKKHWLKALLDAKQSRNPTEPLSSAFGNISLEDAYAVQDLLIKEKLDKGERIIGWKVGATSRPVMEQLGIEEPFLGCMTTESDFTSLKEIRSSDFCKLAIEGEIAFVMGKTLKGPGVTTADVIQATAGVMGAVELVDSRIVDWKVTAQEAIADNALHAGIILGPCMKPMSGFDLVHEGVVLHKNGRLLASACGAEALGNPLNVMVWLANKLATFGKELTAGSIVSTGSLTQFFFAEPGDVFDVSFSNLGQIHFSISP